MKKKKKRKVKKTGRGYAVHPNILRFDYGRTHGFWVRFSRIGPSGNKRVISKSFADGAYGGDKGKAFRAALEWRNATEKRLPPAKKAGSNGELKPPGYSYVKRMLAHGYPRGGGPRRTFMAWVGFLRIEDRKHRSTKWSIPKWGDAIARQGCEDWLAHQKALLNARLRLAGRKKGKRKR